MIYEPLFELEKNGINIKYHTNQGEYTPAHWHGAIELMYILNGVGTILIEGKEYKMIAGEFIVVDSNQIHEARCARASMMIVIHFSRSAMIQIEPNLEKYRISCRRSELLRTNLEDYFQICRPVKKIAASLCQSATWLSAGTAGDCASDYVKAVIRFFLSKDCDYVTGR